MSLYNCFGDSMTLTSAIEVESGHYAAFALYGGEIQERLVESMFCKADGAWPEIIATFEATVAQTSLRDAQRLWTAVRELDNRLADKA